VPSCWKYVLYVSYSLDNPLSSLTANDIRVCYGDCDDKLQTAVYCDAALSDMNRQLDVCYKITDSWSITLYSKLVTTFFVDVKTQLFKLVKFRCKQTTVRHINLEAEIYGQIAGQPVSLATVTVRVRNTISQPTALSRNDDFKRSALSFVMTSGALQIPGTVDKNATVSCSVQSYELITSEKVRNILLFVSFYLKLIIAYRLQIIVLTY
jgi:hypothetical protein